MRNRGHGESTMQDSQPGGGIRKLSRGMSRASDFSQHTSQYHLSSEFALRGSYFQTTVTLPQATHIDMAAARDVLLARMEAKHRDSRATTCAKPNTPSAETQGAGKRLHISLSCRLSRAARPDGQHVQAEMDMPRSLLTGQQRPLHADAEDYA